MLLKFVQSWNAYDPIVSTLSGSSMLLKFVQSWNAYDPIVSTLSGSSMLLNPLHPLNADPFMVVRPSGSSIDFNPVHPLKLAYPISVTVIGMFTSSKYVAFLKAEDGIVVTPSGIVMLVKLLHPAKILLSAFFQFIG